MIAKTDSTPEVSLFAPATGTLLRRIDPPASIQDFPGDPVKQAELAALWSGNVNRWIVAAQLGDVWDLVNYGPRPAFYNPLVTPTPSDAQVAPIEWSAFPGRISALFPNESQDQWNKWADLGALPLMTTDLCSGDTISTPYTPTGPRGWQDEYCEWSVTRNAENKITSVMFTCENPEYWMTLWQVDPAAVLGLYQTLVNPAVTLQDLSLLDGTGVPVIDPTTGRPAYNPLNKWNSGTSSLSSRGGAVHLTSSPNTLGAEFDLAAAATMPRVDGGGVPVTSASALVCCAKYGRIGRNSDPTIGQNVNFAINGSGQPGMIATLTNPPGLYIQTPDFGRFAPPAGHSTDDPSTFWRIERGHVAGPGEPIDRILHAVFEVPASKGYTVGDMTIDGLPINWGSQIVSTITMKLAATVFNAGVPAQKAVTCTTPASDVVPTAQALQPVALFSQYRSVEAAAGESLLSIPVLALLLAQGTTLTNVAVALNIDVPADLGTLAISVGGTGVTVTVTGQATFSGVGVVIATIAVADDAAIGDRDVTVSVTGSPVSRFPVSGLLAVTAKATPRLARARNLLRAGRA